MRKFAYNEQTHKERPFQKLKSTLFLYGSSPDTRGSWPIQAGADITGQLQVRPMLYTLYISINLRVVKMLHTDNKQQITK